MNFLFIIMWTGYKLSLLFLSIKLCNKLDVLFVDQYNTLSILKNCFSILSTSEECCSSIVNYETSFRVITKVLSKYPGRQDIVVRLGYALGNIMAKCDDARLKVMLTFKVMCTVCRCGGQKSVLFSLNDTIYISLGVYCWTICRHCLGSNLV